MHAHDLVPGHLRQFVEALVELGGTLLPGIELHPGVVVRPLRQPQVVPGQGGGQNVLFHELVQGSMALFETECQRRGRLDAQFGPGDEQAEMDQAVARGGPLPCGEAQSGRRVGDALACGVNAFVQGLGEVVGLGRGIIAHVTAPVIAKTMTYRQMIHQTGVSCSRHGVTPNPPRLTTWLPVRQDLHLGAPIPPFRYLEDG